MMSFSKTSQAVLSLHRWDLRYSWRTSLAGPSLPQSLMTAEEHFTTFLALPSLSILQRPALTQLHVAVHLDQGDAVLHAQGGDELLVHGLIAVLSEDTEQSLALVQSLLPM